MFPNVKIPDFILLIVLMVAVFGITFLGLMFFLDVEESNPNSLLVDTAIKPCPADFTCCIEGEFIEKKCSEFQECIGNACVKKVCPHDCCVGTSFKQKSCSSDLVCTENFCVKPACPFECCLEDAFTLKTCDTNFNCVENSCEEIIFEDEEVECPFECCINLDGYENLGCSSGKVCDENVCLSTGSTGSGSNNTSNTTSNTTDPTDNPTNPVNCPFECCEEGTYKDEFCDYPLVCSNNSCVKQECPFDCCLTEEIYADKECSSGFNCVYGYCESESVLCGGSMICAAGTIIACEKSQSTLEVIGETYFVEIIGSSGADCVLEATLIESSLRPVKIGDKMYCNVPYSSELISTYTLENILQGDRTDWCYGSLMG